MSADIFTNIFEGIIKAIGDIIEGIVRLVGEILEGIVRFIGDIIEQFGGIIIGIGVVVLTVSAIIYFGVHFSTTFAQFVFSNPTLTKIFVWTEYVKTVATGLFSATLTKIEAFLNPFILRVLPLFRKLVAPIRWIITHVKNAISWVRFSILGKIYGKLQEIANFILTVRLFAEVWRKWREGKEIQALWTLVKTIDIRMAQEIENTVRGIRSEITGIYYDMLSIVDSVQRDITIIDSKTRYLEDTFKRLYEAFGIQVFGDVAREINRFRRGVIDTVERELLRADSKLFKIMRGFTSPFYQILSIFYQVDKFISEEERLARAFGLNPYRRKFIDYEYRYLPTLYVPRSIMDILRR